MGYITCPKCGTEYYLRHIKYPVKDDGGSVQCQGCKTTLYSWGKGTDDYILVRAEEEIERTHRAELIFENRRFFGIKFRAELRNHTILRWMSF